MEPDKENWEPERTENELEIETSGLGLYILNEDGKPIPEPDPCRWAAWFEESSWRLAVTEFAWGCVSTIFSGMDESFNPDATGDALPHKPVLWETRVIGGKKNGALWEYTSQEDARKGHLAAVEECKAAEENPENRICLNRV